MIANAKSQIRQARERLKGPAWVTPEALNVSTELLQAPLARPSRRALAMGVDLLLIALLSSADNLWLVAALVLMALHFYKKQTRTTSRQRTWVVWLLCLAFLWLGLQHGKNFLDDQQDEDSRPTRTASRKAAPAAVPMAIPASSPAAANTDAQRIAQLEQQLEEARSPKVLRWRDQARRWLDGLGVGFGWAIVYFSLLPVWLQGQTLGKKLFGLRVVELTGKPLNVMTCFSRYGGYAAGMATGMVGFAQVLWDVNRQAIQDKIAHTVVVDLRAPQRAAAATAPPAELAESTEPAQPG